MNKVYVRKAMAASMVPCQKCGANAYESCKMGGNTEHSMADCPYYQQQRG